MQLQISDVIHTRAGIGICIPGMIRVKSEERIGSVNSQERRICELSGQVGIRIEAALLLVLYSLDTLYVVCAHTYE